MLLERYRSGHNEAVLKTVCPQGRVGSNPTLSVICLSSHGGEHILCQSLFDTLGEVPKLAEGTPLERVQVVNSGARVQIPPSPLIGCRFITYCRMETERQKKDKKVLTKHERHDKMYIALLMTE